MSNLSRRNVDGSLIIDGAIALYLDNGTILYSSEEAEAELKLFQVQVDEMLVIARPNGF